jgi:hypothetical protein
MYLCHTEEEVGGIGGRGEGLRKRDTRSSKLEERERKSRGQD